MKTIRIGKDIAINWTITTNGEPASLEDEVLYLEMKDPKGNKIQIEEYEVSGNIIKIGLKGTAFVHLGQYTLTLWKNRGLDGQTVVDAVDAFKLVKYTNEEGYDCSCHK